MFENSGYSSQPQGTAQINWCNPITKDIAWVYLPHLSTQWFPKITSGSFKTTQLGTVRYSGGTNISGNFNQDAYSVQQPYHTMLHAGLHRSTAGTNYLAIALNPGLTNGNLAIKRGSSGVSVEATNHLNTSETSSAFNIPTASGDGAPGVLAIRTDINPIFEFYYNGRYVHAAVISGVWSGAVSITDRYSGTHPDSSTALVAYWNRRLSDVEMRSVTANPWQIFQRRSATPIFAPTGESGVLIPELSSPGVVDLSSTSARPELNVQY